MAQEIFFEQMCVALETTRGTAVTTPTHLVHQGGVVTPRKTRRVATDRRGTLASHYRSTITKAWSEWETVGEEADTGSLPWWLNVYVQGGVTSPSTPGGATNARLWTFTRNISADNIKSFTSIWGDPAVQCLISDFNMGTEMTLSADASAEDGVLLATFKGFGGPLTDQADPTVPAAIAGALLPAQWMQCYIDTSSSIGTTAVTGRVLSASHTIRTGVTQKTMGSGPASDLSYTAAGREQVSAITTTIKMELADMTQYDLWEAGTSLKVRMRYNGPLIESTLYEYVEVDTYGPFEDFAWGDNQGSNRTIEFTINGHVDSTLGSDLRVAVQNARTTL